MSTSVSALSQSARPVRSSRPDPSNPEARLMKSVESVYPTERQIEFLHLHAEIDTLLLELKTIKQLREVEVSQKEVALTH
ncbi:hypothetical protein IQ235_10640 [Oscillatoriales cyanobacterium LEGE 11467]|uniref:Uncharacterized protein n=1 Tax=Zarconia navalis LEGE 11467 TaxID=1828826 RepID=A0A928VZL2_9CYAN|nr:hypothetical protein [Zarconia navalis]MBE9041236.1 hypothetical protein [Zarconia navalis LEGE 11467]